MSISWFTKSKSRQKTAGFWFLFAARGHKGGRHHHALLPPSPSRGQQQEKRLPRQESSIASSPQASKVMLDDMSSFHGSYVRADKHCTQRVRVPGFLVLAVAALSITSVLTFSFNPQVLVRSRLAAAMSRGAPDVCPKNARTSALCAQSGGMPSARSSGSSTARDSAVLVEWEPVPEIQRRIDEGVHYEHYDENGSGGPRYGRRRTHRANAKRGTGVSGTPSVRGVFCGYRVTNEEYARLKSADPDEHTTDYTI